MRLITKKHHKTLKSQLVADKLATFLFTVVGLGVIAAVIGMMLFFTSTVIPLFEPIKLELQGLREPEPAVEAGLSTLPLAFVHDVNAPYLAEVYSTDEGCLIAEGVMQAQTQGNKARSPQRDFIPLRRVWLEWPQAQDVPVLNLSQSGRSQASDLSVNPTTPPLRCHAVGKSRFLVQEVSESGRAAVIDLAVKRMFLGEAQLAELSAADREQLLKSRWLVKPDGRFLVKASSQAPTAALDPSLTLLTTVVWPPGHPIRKLLAAKVASSGQGPTPIFDYRLLEASGSEQRQILLLRAESSLLLMTRTTENFMTGALVPEQRLVAVPRGIREFVPLAMDDAILIQEDSGAFWLTNWVALWALGEGMASSSGADDHVGLQIEDEELKRQNFHSSLSSTAVSVGEVGSGGKGSSIVRSALSFGGNTLVVVDKGGFCAGYDVSLFVLKKGEGNIKPRWRNRCAPSSVDPAQVDQFVVHLHASPSQRLGVIETRGAELIGVDFSTGEVLFQTALPDELGAASDRTVSFGSGGHYLRASGTSGVLGDFKVHAEHIEGSLERMFRKIHYEGYKDPSFSWQSAAATDDFEAKFSLWPLVWGTLKATLYAMLFAAPLGIFAAVYSSEILDRRTRNLIKPTIEMMASLPSVVLGFLAAIVLAPWIEDNILGVIFCGMILPFTLYFFGNIVSHYSARHVSGRGLYASRRLLVLILSGFVLALLGLLQLGSFVESLAFGGDIKIYLSGGQGSAAVLYGILFLPLVLIGLWSVPSGRFAKRWRTFVFLAGPLLSFAIGFFVNEHFGEGVMSDSGYSQRNALVICIAMGFAIIPIIYSLSEDAFTSVPGSLRAGSLACGASVWQTTARVVLPTAASGVFSALMVGFGRAIGETMIVVMATGNSALMSLNPFEGLRSLAANIAVELPEAPFGGTHYRILFFSGFILFILTFVMNTLAEVLRTRYRQRNKAL
jgi:ABC-type uncharacterized transport system permease subunit